MVNHKIKGDEQYEEEFISLVINNQDMLYKIAYTYVKNKDDALDIVQETVYKAYISYKKLREKKYAKTWLVRILINNANDYIKKNKKIISLNNEYLDVLCKDDNNNIEDKIIIDKVLNDLEENEKSVIILKFFEDFTLKDISKIMGLPLSTVKSILYRTLKKLKVNVEEMFDDE